MLLLRHLDVYPVLLQLNATPERSDRDLDSRRAVSLGRGLLEPKPDCRERKDATR